MIFDAISFEYDLHYRIRVRMMPTNYQTQSIADDIALNLYHAVIVTSEELEAWKKLLSH